MGAKLGRRPRRAVHRLLRRASVTIVHRGLPLFDRSPGHLGVDSRDAPPVDQTPSRNTRVSMCLTPGSTHRRRMGSGARPARRRVAPTSIRARPGRTPGLRRHVQCGPRCTFVTTSATALDFAERTGLAIICRRHQALRWSATCVPPCSGGTLHKVLASGAADRLLGRHTCSPRRPAVRRRVTVRRGRTCRSPGSWATSRTPAMPAH